MREIECFLVLSEELHFGRTAERMFISQSRVSQLTSALERRIGAPLVARTSRRVQLTEFGAEFLAALAPTYRALAGVVEETRMRARNLPTPIRVGFQGAIYDSIAKAISQFESQHPRALVHIKELPLGDPFSDVLAGRVDAAVVLLPVEEPELVVGLVFSQQTQTLAVSVDHPFGKLEKVTAEDLAQVSLVPITGPAPQYWRKVHSPKVTPGGIRIPTRGGANTVQEGLSQVASSRSGLILCAATAAYNQRSDVRFVPVNGLPSSALGLVWRVDHESPHIRLFAEAVEEALNGTSESQFRESIRTG
ncbi:DNA-binding transcriptional regulator, LysR family [Arthrobacter alpinus]|uniref:DNA-binding transcriptional regulator, LysR family n=1 Tax=Arthrobacter alpinus TaxID=656366 RepID=A0A1H5PHA4_9MICC|nr:LysR family transcriptional regulator [Arthrobacter alpinus]SEF12427.1 DNA-binding transcriptional regulator, LysR family [Arthrobacter alpinus]